jgi:[calcium/calmodulin-dependent protein kinase] kinase
VSSETIELANYVGSIDGTDSIPIQQHPWVTDNGRTQLLNVDDELQHLFISDNDIKSAFTGLTLRAKVRITAKLREKLD